jgi:hypothetical protein
MPNDPAAVGPGSEGIQLEPLAAWHLPLLGDPAFVPLHPLLQRAVLLQLPERLLQLLRGGQGHRPPRAVGPAGADAPGVDREPPGEPQWQLLAGAAPAAGRG